MKSVDLESQSTIDEVSTLPSTFGPAKSVSIFPSQRNMYRKFYYAFVLASNSIGISALAYPSAMAKTGLVPFFLLLILAIVINYFTGYLLMYCA